MITTCGIFLVSLDNLILIGHPTNSTGKWSIPKGELDEGETKLECAIREFQEEACILLSKHNVFHLKDVKYKSGKKTLSAFYFKSLIIASEFSPRCTSLVTSVPGMDPFPEIDIFRWVTFEEARELLHETQVECLDLLAAYTEPAIKIENDNSKLEIERRWLLKCLPNNVYKEKREISQHYADDGRYRSCTTFIDNLRTETKYYLTKKTTISHGVNLEDEVEITGKDFLFGVDKSTKSIFKTRYIHDYNGLKLEIDAFHFDDKGSSLYIMEVELKEINQIVIVPEFIQNCIIKEITGEKEYSNYNLAISNEENTLT